MASCPHGQGGDLAEKRVKVVDEMAESVGLGQGRIRMAWPRPGLEGPLQAIEAFRASLVPSTLGEPYAMTDGLFLGMDHALSILKWFRTRPELSSTLPLSLRTVFGEVEEEGNTLLYLQDLPDLDLLLSLMIREWRLKSLFEDAARLLKEMKIAVKPVMTLREVNESKASRVLVFCPCHLPSFDRRLEVLTLDELAQQKKPSSRKKGPPPVQGFRFRIQPKERQKLVSDLKASPAPMVCGCPYQLAQIMFLRREGSWQEAFSGEPYMAFSEKWRVRTGETVQ
jgi:hypothetical protein